MNYELVDHTADFGIRVFGPDAAGLFTNAALALFDCLTETDKLNGVDKIAVSAEGVDWPDLMVNWLRELLYLWAGREMLVKNVKVDSISEHKISASVVVDRFDPEVHVVKSEIKAVTYHQIQVIADPKGWAANIIFDV